MKRPAVERRALVGLALLLLLTAAIHGRTLGFDFVDYDDSQRITSNPMVRQGLTLESLAWAWTTTDHAPYWHPLSWMSHLLDVELFGMNPAGHHATNVVLHLLSTLLVFAVWRSASGRPLHALAVATLFALHPVQVMTVAWVAARPDLLSAMLALAALLAHGRRGREPLALVLFALAILAKPSIAALALVVPFWDAWPLGRAPADIGGRFRAALPWLAVATLGALAVLLDAEDVGGVEAEREVPWPARAANAAVAYVRYLGKLVWPTGFAVHYPHPDLPGGQPWAVWQVAAAVVSLLLASAAAVRLRRVPAVRTGWGWFLIALLPVAGLVQVGDQGIALRYLYFPMLGVATLAVWLAGTARGSQARAIVGIGILAGACAVGSWQQLTPWRGPIPLYLQALRVNPDNPLMHYNLGLAYDSVSGHEDEAEWHYRRAIEIDPGYPQPRINLGHRLVARGRVDAAIEQYRTVLELRPDAALALAGLGVVYSDRGEHDAAIEHLRRAVGAAPDLLALRKNLALALERAGRLEERNAVLRELARLEKTQAGSNPR